MPPKDSKLRNNDVFETLNAIENITIKSGEDMKAMEGPKISIIQKQDDGSN